MELQIFNIFYQSSKSGYVYTIFMNNIMVHLEKLPYDDKTISCK